MWYRNQHVMAVMDMTSITNCKNPISSSNNINNPSPQRAGVNGPVTGSVRPCGAATLDPLFATQPSQQGIVKTWGRFLCSLHQKGRAVTSSDHLGSKWYMDVRITHSVSVISCKVLRYTERYDKAVWKCKSWKLKDMNCRLDVPASLLTLWTPS